MSKKVTEIQKKEILNCFLNGSNIDSISSKFNFSTQTIVRQIKNLIGSDEFLRIKMIEKNQSRKINSKPNKSTPRKIKEENQDKLSTNKNRKTDYEEQTLLDQESKFVEQDQKFFSRDSDLKGNNFEDPFFEIVPLATGVELEHQRDCSSRPITKFDLPKMVFMIVNNKIELEPKSLKQYPEWEFLPEKDLDRQTLEIFSEQKLAKSKCKKDQKILKIPDAKVFLIASKFLKSKGISRIIYEDVLLSL